MENLQDEIREIRGQLRRAMNGVTSTSMREKGIVYKLNFGVSYPDIKEIARTHEPNAELASALWKEDIREFKILATLLCPADTFPREEAKRWVEEIPYLEIAEHCARNLFAHLPYKEDLLIKQIKLLNDIFHHPNAQDGHFDEKMFKMKKKELKDRIISNQDDKFYYSLEKLFSYFGKDEPLGISTYGYLKEIDGIANAELYDYFLQCIQEDQKNIYVVGNVDESIVSLFAENLSFPESTQEYETVYQMPKHHDDIIEIFEKQDITQAKLNMGYLTDANFVRENHYAFTVFNMIFGSSSQSKLFKTVREKHSLCYYISSSYDAFNSIVVITAGIESQDYEKVKELVAEQLKAMQNGKFDDKDIEIAKLMIKNALVRTKDEPISQIALLFNKNITHKEETDEEYISKIMAVSKQDIIDVCQSMTLDTIFLLKGRDE